MADIQATAEKRSPTEDDKADTPSVHIRGLSDDHNGPTASQVSQGIAIRRRSSKWKTTTLTGLMPAVSDSQEESPRDPFRRLTSLEVGLIVDFLPAEVTQTLRSVSKLWKASSEYHSGLLAIRKHFPRSASATKTFQTREEANLEFRRLCENPITTYHNRLPLTPHA